MPVSLSSVKIRGVRSYSPYEHKAQTIEFMPLTLIVGANGSGKTTLIESLKFIISGEEPPLSDSRRNFIHTTKSPDSSFDKSTSYASIELRFENSKGEHCIAKREISKIGTGKNPIPSISSSYQVDKKRWIHVHKQDDWNKTIPQFFNFPNQAILNNVVLCHQENNLWCMGDSSTVKQIFDRIFSCEQYKKEIKYMDAEIKACKSDLTMASKDLSHNKERVETLEKFNNELSSLNADIDKLSSRVKGFDSKIDDSQRIKSTLLDKIKEIETKVKETENLKQRALEISERSGNLRESLHETYLDPQVVSDFELDQKVEEHTTLIEQKKRRRAELRSREENTKNKTSQFEKDKSILQDSINELKVIKLKFRETHDNLVKRLEKIKTEQPLETLDPADIKMAIEILESYEKTLSQYKCEQSELEDNLSSKQQKLTKKISNLDGTYQGLLHKIKNKEVYMKKLSEQLDKANPMAKDLGIVLKNLEKMTSLTDQMTPPDHVETLKSLISESAVILNNLVVGIQKDNIMGLTVEIEKEHIEIEKIKTEINDIENQKRDLKIEASQIEIEYNKVKTSSKEAHKRVVLFQSARQNVISTHQRYQKEKDIIESRNIDVKIEELVEIEKRIEFGKKELNSLSLECSRLSDDIEQSFGTFEAFKVNKQIRELNEKLKFLKERISVAESDTANVDELKNLQSKFKEIEKQEIELREKRSMVIGSKNQMDREMIRLEETLKNYTNAHSKYAESLGKVSCNEIIISDLEKLKECFNQSIIGFHNQMIAKINEVLRVRWRQIYKGSDVDQIELVDEEVTKGKDKKVFNYYIAMRKGGIRMKMREKSSAGQKALASIILRMALAELFVKDFAFISLDEPTANLDLANVQSLAKAIGSYVRRRNKHGVNIQWIIITHDEQFLKALDSECSPYYYRTELDHEGCSKIAKISYQEAHQSSVHTSATNTQDS